MIWDLCYKHIEKPSETSQLEIGARLGDFSNNLRSALNYTTSYFSETKLKSVLTTAEYKKLERHRDFPYSNSQSGFNDKLIVKHVQAHFSSVYTVLEQAQPYHTGQAWLAHLMLLSNTDKHE